ncbi:dihydrolipoyl dehydrogenase family protein [Salinarchaeum laminariae]|uniref:dihydrolipoyl dehydrogenase family protein n=1 Tax=Salinarchaeum laminariae TaxID=869888 RepID=UPI0020BDD54C|nr:dihydrolipoyl dehydrogenase [Salinarchaeum laminariae]
MVVGDVSTGTDVLVIGGGPAGYTAAIRAGQLDLDVTLVEKEAYGGTCLNHGCIPSKALITATDLAERAGDAEHMGIHADPAVDLGAMTEWKDGVVDQLTSGVEKLCKANGVNLIEGTATFAGEGRARVAHGGEGQGSETIDFEHAIVATGSRAMSLPGFDFADEPILDARQALALEEVPDSMLVVGAGYIGMELAGVFAKLGTDVTIIELLDSALPAYDDELARPVKKRLESHGVEFHFGVGAEEWTDNGDGTVTVTAAAMDGGGPAANGETPEDGGTATDGGEAAEAGEAADEATESEQFVAETVLVAIGREPVTDTLDLDAIGLEPTEQGVLETDHRAETAVDDVYAVGDVAGEPMLAHKGSAEGKVAAEVIAGEPAALDHQAIPAAVFTEPEIATVGLTEEEAVEEGFDPVVGEFPFGASGRALTADETDGFVRVVADAETEFLLGGQIVGPDASELVAEIALGIELGARLEDVASTIHTHPTLAEAVMEACENARGEAIHTLNR